MKAEIALTCEQTTRRQIEFAFERYKKQVAEKQSFDSKKLEVRYLAFEFPRRKITRNLNFIYNQLYNMTSGNSRSAQSYFQRKLEIKTRNGNTPQ